MRDERRHVQEISMTQRAAGLIATDPPATERIILGFRCRRKRNQGGKGGCGNRGSGAVGGWSAAIPIIHPRWQDTAMTGCHRDGFRFALPILHVAGWTPEVDRHDVVLVSPVGNHERCRSNPGETVPKV